MKAICKIALTIHHNNGRGSNQILKGDEVQIEENGCYINVVHNDNNYRLPATHLNNFEIKERVNE